MGVSRRMGLALGALLACCPTANARGREVFRSEWSRIHLWQSTRLTQAALWSIVIFVPADNKPPAVRCKLCCCLNSFSSWLASTFSKLLKYNFLPHLALWRCLIGDHNQKKLMVHGGVEILSADFGYGILKCTGGGPGTITEKKNFVGKNIGRTLKMPGIILDAPFENGWEKF